MYILDLKLNPLKKIIGTSMNSTQISNSKENNIQGVSLKPSY